MPSAAPTPCRVPLCPHLRPCPVHGRNGGDRDSYRASPSQRGYDSAWRRFRRSFLAANPLCVDCHKAGRVQLAEQVHHEASISTAPHRRLDPTNCTPLCAVCHGRRGGLHGV